MEQRNTGGSNTFPKNGATYFMDEYYVFLTYWIGILFCRLYFIYVFINFMLFLIIVSYYVLYVNDRCIWTICRAIANNFIFFFFLLLTVIILILQFLLNYKFIVWLKISFVLGFLIVNNDSLSSYYRYLNWFCLFNF